VLVTGLVALPAIGQRTPFFTRGEPREALVVQTVFRGEGFVLPMRNGDELPSKPPLFHWLGAAASLVQGHVSEGAIRAPGLVAALVTVVATAAAAWAWWGPSAALLATVLLGTSFQWTASMVSARVDMILAATISLALLLFARAVEAGRRVPAAAYVLLTLATLTKGPVGLVVPCAVAVVTLALRGELRFLGWRDARLLGLATAVAGLWYVAAIVVGGDAFFAKQILKENVFRVLDADSVNAGHVEPFWYYAPLLAAGLAPWSLFVPGLVADAIASLRGRAAVPDAAAVAGFPADSPPAADPRPSFAVRGLDRHTLFALVWAAIPFVMFSLAGSKRAVYLLPAYPAYAMLLAGAWTRVVRDGAGPVATRLLQAGAMLSGTLLAVVGVVVLAGTSGLPVEAWLKGVVSRADANNVGPMLDAAREHRAVVLPCAALTLAAAWATFHAARRGAWARLVAATAIAMLALSATVSTTLLPALASKRSPRDFLALVEQKVPVTAPLSFYRAFDYGAVFYRQAPIPLRQALTEVPEINGAWLLTWPAFLPDLEEEARRQDTGSGPAGTYAVETVLPAGRLDPTDRTTLVLVRIVRRIGDEHSDGN
jgi:4-amino-4-deoxy-L-arabinose transferase-like glycosyltransferase